MSVGRDGWYDSDFAMHSLDDNHLLSGKIDFWAAAVSAEGGYKFSNDDKWFVEPQTQLQYTFIGTDEYVSSYDVQIEQSDVHSLIGRAGVRLGKDVYDEDKIYNFYVRGDIMHEFLGDKDFAMTGLKDKLTLNKSYDGSRTWYDVGVGLSGKFANSSYYFIDFERQLGNDIDCSWEVNLGLRKNF